MTISSATGAEIKPAELGHIFERGFRGEQAALKERTGAGMGLFVARNLVEAHAGKRSMIQVLAKGVGNIPVADFKPLMISKISPGLRNLTVEAIIVSNFGVRNVNLKNGSVVKVSEIILKDDTGEIKLSAWREHAEMISQFPSGARIKLKNVTSKQGFREASELTTTNSTIIELIPSENHNQ